MNKDTIDAEDFRSLENVFKDHQELKDAIWEVYSEHLKAAQEEDILLPSDSFRRLGIQRSQSPRNITGSDQTKGIVPVSDQAVPITEANLTTEMENNTGRRSISPQLNEILDLAIIMEYEDSQEVMEISPSTPEIQTLEEGKQDEINTTLNTAKDSNSQKQETIKSLDINQNMSVNQNYNDIRPWAQTDEEKEKIILYSKNARLPGIEQVINKTSFANQRSDYYSRTAASDGKNVPYGTGVTQQFSNQQLLNPPIKQAITSTDSTLHYSMSTREGLRYSYPNTFPPSRPTIPRKPVAPESFNITSEQPLTEPQGCNNSQLLNPSVSKSDSWQFSNVSPSTSSLTSSQAQFQTNIAPQTASGMMELGMPHPGQTSPSIKNSKGQPNNQYQNYKTQSSADYRLPVAGGTVPRQMQNFLHTNAMATRSDTFTSFPSNNRTILKNNDYMKNLYPPSYNSLISSSLPSSKLNQTSMHLGNVNAQKLGPGSMTPSPTYSPNEVLSPYGTINSQGVKTSPTTPPSLVTNQNTCDFVQQLNNVAGQQNLQYSSAGSSTPAQQFMQYTTGQMVTTPSGVNQQLINYAPKNSALITQQGFPMKNNTTWSGAYNNAPAHYRNIQGFPSPISSSRVQEFSSPRTQDISRFTRPDLSSTQNQQFTPPGAQQYPATRALEYPYSFQQQYRSPDIPSTSSQDFPSTQGQFATSRPEQHSFQFPQRFSAPTPSAMDPQMLNLTGTNPFVQQDGSTTKNYPTVKPPRKRRVTKGITVAQTKRIQKKRKEVEEKLLEHLGNEHCDQKTSVIITKHLYHVQTCPNWLAGEECPLCNQICEMLIHSTECQNLNCPFLYCGIKALEAVAESFSNPKFVYGFLKQLNISEEEIKSVYVLKNWKEKPTQDQTQC